jgi:hypothetical protein
MKASLRNSSVLVLFLLAVVAMSQETSQRAKAGGVAKPASKAPAVSTVKRPLRTLAGANACPGTLITTLPFNDSGDTSTAGTTNKVSDVNCAAAIPHSPSDQGPDLVYSFTILGPVNNLTITATPTAPYDTSIYILSTCNVGTSCVAYADTFCAGCNPPETITVTNLAPGTYHLYIDSFFSTTPGNPDFFLAGAQGPYTLSITGSFGVAPTPTFTATNTPTRTFTATNTPTTVPTSTPTPAGQGGPGRGPATPIPTLSGWMLAAFAAALVAVALFLTRRS